MFYILLIQNNKTEENEKTSMNNYIIYKYDYADGTRKDISSIEYKFDLVIEAVTDKNNKIKLSDFISDKIEYEKIIEIDSNMNMEGYIKEKNTFSYLFKTMIKRSNYYFSNPKYFFNHLKVGIKRLLLNS